jgi:phospholipase C
VVIMQENHTFDNVFGFWCTRTGRCDGTRRGRLSDGSWVRLSRASDAVPKVDHGDGAHRTAWHHGAMDGFDLVKGCGTPNGYRCYTQFRLTDIPNLGALAKQFVIADRIFESDGVPSWGSHLELATGGRLDGFTGDNPHRPLGTVPNGWGCDSLLDARWRRTPSSPIKLVPACVPDRNGNGPYRPSPVPWVPTIMDRLTHAGLSWKIYSLLPSMASQGYSTGGYGWAICPTFADCLYTSQAQNNVPYTDVMTDAANGTLPEFSVVTPPSKYSQHNAYSMALGDNYIGQVMTALMQSPEWSSTAVIITYDDSGGFYDHVPSPDGTPAFRLPFVIVSPWAKPGFTDHHTGDLSSILAFVEHTFGLKPLSDHDATAYALGAAFDFSQSAQQPIPMTHTRISRREMRYLRAHRPSPTSMS